MMLVLRIRRRQILVGLSALLALVAFGVSTPTPVHGVAAPTWLAGAAAKAVTPPRYSAADDARDFPFCDTTVFNGARTFDFEEPYVDTGGTGHFDYTKDAWCDLGNANHRYDGTYLSGGVDHMATWVHDDAWARALAISDGTHVVVLESITSQGLSNEDIDRIRVKVKALHPDVTETFVSSTHNESTPDPIGIYGAPDNPSGAAGLFSGINDYYMSYLVEQATKAADDAVKALRPARLRINEIYSHTVEARLSKTFLTTTDAGAATATARKMRVFQAVDATTGANIETMLNWAAHNQQTGHAPDNALAMDPVSHSQMRINRAITDDWPGVFAKTVETAIGGDAMFMVGENGSIEDPHLSANVDHVCPPIPPSTTTRSEGCLELPAATGAAVAHDVLGALAGAEEIAPHALSARRDIFDAPLENSLFAAAFAAGLFAHRHLDPAFCGTGPCLKTEVGLLDFGPDLEMLVNPGESYPALIDGHPWGIEQVSCPGRANPPVPSWHGRSKHHLEMGLGDDMIGYVIPGPGWYAQPAVHLDPTCMGADPQADVDPRGHYHKLESESVGPTAGSLVAEHLAALADGVAEPPSARINAGSFVKLDGSLSRDASARTAGMWLAPDGSTSLQPGTGLLVGAPGVDAFGGRRVDWHGVFIDYDGLPQAGPDIDTRGMQITLDVAYATCRPTGTSPGQKYFMDPYQALPASGPGPARSGPAALAATCPFRTGGGGLPNSSAMPPSAAGWPLPLGVGGLAVLALLRRSGRLRRRPSEAVATTRDGRDDTRGARVIL
jgi:hypothetical protein